MVSIKREMTKQNKPIDPRAEAERVLGGAGGERPHPDIEEANFLGQQLKQKGKTPNVWEEARKLLGEQAKTSPRQETHYSIQDIDWHPNDDAVIEDPIVKTSRSRGASRDKSVKFQKYAFKLFANADKHSGRNSGRDPNKSMGPQRWADGDQTAPDRGISVAGSSDRVQSIANVAQSMPKGFSTGVLSTDLDYLFVPREPTAETAWVFDEARFHDFIAWKISDEALSEYEKDSKGIGLVKLFGSALKAYFNLYTFFITGTSDKGFVEDRDAFGPVVHKFWSSPEARRRARSRLIAEGIGRYGTPSVPKLPDGYGSDRSKKAWKTFKKMKGKVLNLNENVTSA
jgi:hypothetical protein